MTRLLGLAALAAVPVLVLCVFFVLPVSGMLSLGFWPDGEFAPSAVLEVLTRERTVRVLAFTYTYSFVKNDRLEAGASIGFDIVGFEAEATVPARLRSEREERSGPAPLVGLDVAGRIRGPWYAEARVQYLKATVGDVDGSLIAFEVNGLYRLHRNITLGLGYNSFDVDIDSRDAGDSGRLKLGTAGPQLFARVGF